MFHSYSVSIKNKKVTFNVYSYRFYRLCSHTFENGRIGLTVIKDTQRSELGEVSGSFYLYGGPTTCGSGLRGLYTTGLVQPLVRLMGHGLEKFVPNTTGSLSESFKRCYLSLSCVERFCSINKSLIQL